MTTWTIAKLIPHDETDPDDLYAILPDDGTRALAVEMDDVLALHRLLVEFLDHGTTETLDEYAEELGFTWLSSGDAARRYGIPTSTMRQWMSTSAHAEKRGSQWYAPDILVRGWVARYTPHKGM